MQRQLRFLSGLPRSGSTLLTKVMNQNPEVFASSTSPLLDYVQHSAIYLSELKRQHSSGHYIDVSRVIKASVFSFYDSDKRIIVDKNRGWIGNYRAIEKDLESEPKIILTLRPVEEVVTSFYKLFESNGDKQSIQWCWENQVKNIYDLLMFSYETKDKLCIVEYKDLISDTQSVLSKVENFIGAEPIQYDLNNIKDTDPENDEKWGIKNLHKIRPTISPNNYIPEDIMSATHLRFFQQQTKRLYDLYEVRY